MLLCFNRAQKYGQNLDWGEFHPFLLSFSRLQSAVLSRMIIFSLSLYRILLLEVWLSVLRTKKAESIRWLRFLRLGLYVRYLLVPLRFIRVGKDVACISRISTLWGEKITQGLLEFLISSLLEIEIACWFYICFEINDACLFFNQYSAITGALLCIQLGSFCFNES